MSTTTRVSREQRFTKHNPCPVCGGGDDDKRHQGIRCKMGFLSDDGRYAHCGNTDYAGGLQPDRNSMTYPHRLDGPCRCGEDHSAGVNERYGQIGRAHV